MFRVQNEGGIVTKALCSHYQLYFAQIKVILIHFSKNNCFLLISRVLKFPWFCLKFSNPCPNYLGLHFLIFGQKYRKRPSCPQGKQTFWGFELFLMPLYSWCGLLNISEFFSEMGGGGGYSKNVSLYLFTFLLPFSFCLQLPPYEL